MAQAKAKSAPVKNVPLSHGVGRRKTAVARVWLRRGKGSIRVNNQDVASYFDTALDIQNAKTPLLVVPSGSSYDAKVTVVGGGKTSQSDAVKLGIARSLVELDESMRTILRSKKLLTVDSRVKERKKPGQKGARRRFQFTKR